MSSVCRTPRPRALNSFDVDDSPGARLEDRAGAAVPEGRLESRAPITFIPHPIEFAGMPNVRWWEFEDRQTDFGNIQASTTGLALLVLAEFCLIYGNDWSLVPFYALPTAPALPPRILPRHGTRPEAAALRLRT